MRRTLAIRLFLTAVVSFPIWFAPVLTASINVSEGRAPWKDKKFVLDIEAAKLAQQGYYSFEDARQGIIDGRARAEQIREFKTQGVSEFLLNALGFIVITGFLIMIWRTPPPKS
jgi:hypothetical protein